mmetsp:Transcript_5557/g.9946  ORF Transcript_5557/g.9946 Transcript_5557/m.9946 type:complete len:223 (-) Transcript_5557:232-900(-)
MLPRHVRSLRIPLMYVKRPRPSQRHANSLSLMPRRPWISIRQRLKRLPRHVRRLRIPLTYMKRPSLSQRRAKRLGLPQRHPKNLGPKHTESHRPPLAHLKMGLTETMGLKIRNRRPRRLSPRPLSTMSIHPLRPRMNSWRRSWYPSVRLRRPPQSRRATGGRRPRDLHLLRHRPPRSGPHGPARAKLSATLGTLRSRPSSGTPQSSSGSAPTTPTSTRSSTA